MLKIAKTSLNLTTGQALRQLIPMSHTLRMLDLFGSFLADGDVGNRFRFCEVEPALSKHDWIIFNFAGVTNMTDSFCNACFENLAEQHPAEVRAKVRFKNCSPLIKDFIGNALANGFASATHQRA